MSHPVNEQWELDRYEEFFQELIEEGVPLDEAKDRAAELVAQAWEDAIDSYEAAQADGEPVGLL
jgi:lipopolysaccharide biosynthesis regulator YciM